jgi:hypothetical protein
MLLTSFLSLNSFLYWEGGTPQYCLLFCSVRRIFTSAIYGNGKICPVFWQADQAHPLTIFICSSEKQKKGPNGGKRRIPEQFYTNFLSALAGCRETTIKKVSSQLAG